MLGAEPGRVPVRGPGTSAKQRKRDDLVVGTVEPGRKGQREGGVLIGNLEQSVIWGAHSLSVAKHNMRWRVYPSSK